MAKKRKLTHQCHLDRKSQPNMSIYCEEFPALYFALVTLANFFWGCAKPVLILTDHKGLTSCFETKEVHPSLWNFLDLMLAYNIVLTHVPGGAIASTDLLSLLKTDSGATVQLGLTDSISIREVKVSIKSKYADITINEVKIGKPVNSTNRTFRGEYTNLLKNVPELQERCPELTKYLMFHKIAPQ